MHHRNEELVYNANKQAGYLADIAESLRIISGRTSLRQIKLEKENRSLWESTDYFTTPKEELIEVNKRIEKNKKEIRKCEANREKKWEAIWRG